jgi:hypothetical protein
VVGMEGLEEGDWLLHPRSHTFTNQHTRHLSRARARAHALPHTPTHAHMRTIDAHLCPRDTQETPERYQAFTSTNSSPVYLSLMFMLLSASVI